MRGSGAIDANEGVAVAAFVVERQVERQRRPSVALGHGHRAGRQHGGKGLRQGRREALREPVWGGEPAEGGGGRRPGSRYGGSSKIRSYWAPDSDAPPRKRRASVCRTSALA